MSQNTETSTIAVEDASTGLAKFNRIVHEGLGRAVENGDIVLAIVLAADLAALETTASIDTPKPARKLR